MIKRDPKMREFILELARAEFAGKQETESRFDRVLEELRRDREDQARKWEEQNRKWDVKRIKTRITSTAAMRL